MTILENRSGRMTAEAMRPIMPETEWPTKMQESTCSSSKIASICKTLKRGVPFKIKKNQGL